MALNIQDMANVIKTALNASAPISSVDAFALALATALVPYIQANAVVNPTALVAPPGGGPVTGTGTVA
jgi:hypothetical protein